MILILCCSSCHTFENNANIAVYNIAVERHYSGKFTTLFPSAYIFDHNTVTSSDAYVCERKYFVHEDRSLHNVTMALALPANTLPPAQPVYVLRGHAAAIHTILFFRGNTRILTGDAEGWIVIWSVAIKRPVAVWRAHEATILGAQMWEEDKIITYVLFYSMRLD